MSKKSLRAARLVAAAFVPFGAVGAAGYAVAITSNAFTYSPALNGAVMIDAMDLAPDDSESAQNYSINFTGNVHRTNTDVGCYVTGLNLPQGAKLVELRVFYKSSDQWNPTVYIMRHTPSTGVFTEILVEVISNNENVRKAIAYDLTTNGDRTINNATFGYGFGVCIGSLDVFYGARLAYSYTSAGD
jgi:hypothetical protein